MPKPNPLTRRYVILGLTVALAATAILTTRGCSPLRFTTAAEFRD